MPKLLTSVVLLLQGWSSGNGGDAGKEVVVDVGGCCGVIEDTVTAISEIEYII